MTVWILLGVAMLLAGLEYSDLDVEAYLERLAGLARAVARSMPGPDHPYEAIEHIARFLHQEVGLSGNLECYDDPRNSFLNDVLDRRLGIPISLSVIWIDVGRRLGLPIEGVGLPGHFIVRWRLPDLPSSERILIDPFHGGIVLTLGDCERRLEENFGPMAWYHGILAPASDLAIIGRMLLNLKTIYARAEDHERLVAVLQLFMLVKPNATEELRDLGLSLLRLGHREPAVKCLVRYLELVPDAPEADSVRELILQSRRETARWN